MEIVIIILQAITMIITALFIVINFLSNLRENRKKNILSGISEVRKERWQSLLTVSSEIGAQVKIISLDYINIEKIKDNYFNLVKFVYHLSYVLNSTYEIDIDIITSAFKLLDIAEEICFKGAQEKTSELIDVYQSFYHNVSVYSNVEWTRIKEQAQGYDSEMESWEKQYQRVSKSQK